MTLQRPEDVQHVEEYSRLVNKQLKIEVHIYGHTCDSQLISVPRKLLVMVGPR